MKSFSQITDTGRGRLLFTSNRLREEGRLYLTTTGDFIFSQKNRDYFFGNQEEAIDWAVQNRLCQDKREFLSKCVEVLRIPYKSIVPKVRLLCEEDAAIDPPTPKLRAQEFIQHPIFNRCLIKHSSGIEAHQLDEDQRTEVLRLVNEINSHDYYGDSPVAVGPETTICDGITDMHAHGIRIEHETEIYDLNCFTALAVLDLPYDIRDHIRDLVIDESTWLIIPDFYDVWNKENRLQFALIAIAVCIHFQLNYEYVYSPGENPLDIFQGIDISQDMDPAF